MKINAFSIYLKWASFCWACCFHFRTVSIKVVTHLKIIQIHNKTNKNKGRIYWAYLYYSTYSLPLRKIHIHIHLHMYILVFPSLQKQPTHIRRIQNLPNVRWLFSQAKYIPSQKLWNMSTLHKDMIKCWLASSMCNIPRQKDK